MIYTRNVYITPGWGWGPLRARIAWGSMPSHPSSASLTVLHAEPNGWPTADARTCDAAMRPVPRSLYACPAIHGGLQGNWHANAR